MAVTQISGITQFKQNTLNPPDVSVMPGDEFVFPDSVTAGNATGTGQFFGQNGSFTLPSFSFANDNSSGMYWSNTATSGAGTGGSDVAVIISAHGNDAIVVDNTAGTTSFPATTVLLGLEGGDGGTVSGPILAFLADTATGLFQSSTGTMSITAASTDVLDFTSTSITSNVPLSMSASSTNFIHNVTDPVAEQDAATKHYVDVVAINGISWKEPVLLATTTSLPAYMFTVGSPAGTGDTITINATGTLTVDSVVTALGNRILVKNETTGTTHISNVEIPGESFDVLDATGIYIGAILYDTTTNTNGTVSDVIGNHISFISTVSGFATDGDSITWDNKPFNGIYTVTTAGAVGVQAVLTRALDSNTAEELEAGTAMFVTSGTVNADYGFVQTATVTTVDTSDIIYTTFTSAVSSYAAGNGLDLSGSTFSISTDTSLVAYAGGSPTSLTVQNSATGAILTVSDGLAVQVDNSTIAISSDQLIVKAGGITATQLATNSVTFVKTEQVIRETPSGSVNGSNVTFTLAHTASTGSECVFLNGILQDSGAGNDYTISGGTITFLSAPQTNDKIRVNYWY